MTCTEPWWIFLPVKFLVWIVGSPVHVVLNFILDTISTTVPVSGTPVSIDLGVSFAVSIGISVV